MRKPRPSLFARFGWWISERFGHITNAHIAALSEESLLDRAEALIRARETKEASRILEAIAKRKILDAKILERLAHLLQRNGSPAAARNSHLRAAQAYLQNRSVPPAVSILKSVLTVSKDCVEARLMLAQVYESVANLEDAAGEYIESVKLLTARGDHDLAQKALARVRDLQRARTMLDGETELAINPLTCNPSLYQPEMDPSQPVPIARVDKSREITQPVQPVSEDDLSQTVLDLRLPVQRPPAMVTEPDNWAAVGKDAAEQMRARARAEAENAWATKTATDFRPIDRDRLPAETLVKIDTAVDFQVPQDPAHGAATTRVEPVSPDASATMPDGTMFSPESQSLYSTTTIDDPAEPRASQPPQRPSAAPTDPSARLKRSR